MVCLLRMDDDMLKPDGATCYNTSPEESTADVYTCPRTPERIIYQSPSKKCKASCSKLSVNEKLQQTLEKHGIAKHSACSFLHGLLKDKEFKNLVRENLDNDNDDSSDDESSGVRMTRSKLKEAMQNSPFKAPTKETVERTLPTFTELPLPENDDDDDEYKPRESSFASDTQDQSYSELHNKTMAPEAGEIIDVEEDLVLDIPEEDDVVDELTEAPPENSDDIISKRTRSKHSLQSTSLNVLEAAFDPPDASADMYSPTNVLDYDWQKWLSELMNDEGTDNIVEEDDPENDPDFNYNPEMDKPDKEDMKDDSSVRVSKKELYGLLDENTLKNDRPAAAYTERSQPARRKRYKSRYCDGLPECSSNSEIPLLQLSSSQVALLTQQLQQHVQLLAQSNLLCRNRTDCEEFVSESKELLYELKDVGQSQINRLQVEKSFVTPWNLEEALKLCKLEICPSEPCVRLLRMEKMKRHVPIAKRIAEIMGNSEVFMYKELLPISAPNSKFQPQKMAFLLSEDCLLALGIAEMAGMPNHFELISRNMLPTKTYKQIAARFRNVTYCRNSKDAVNPIFRYRTNGTLPKPNKSVKHIFQHTAKKPVDMKGNLPCWVLSLKPMHVPEESSDDSVSDWNQPQFQSTPHNARPVGICNNQQLISVSSVKAIMIPYIATSLCKISPAVPISQITVFQTPTTTLGVQNIDSTPTNDQLSVSVMSISQSTSMPTHARKSDVTSTSNTLKTTPTAQVQSSTLYGQRKSAGKSIRRLTESHEERVVSPSSSSSSDDEEVLELTRRIQQSSPEEKVADAQLEDIQPNESEDNRSIDSEDDEQSDHEGPSTVRKTPEKMTPMETVGSKSIDEAKILPTGGFLQKTHPRLSGRKTKSGTKDATRLHLTAKMVKSLEEETIVQLDPKRTEKEKIFAMGYLERVEKTLKHNPGMFKAFLDILVKYNDGTKSPVDLHAELSHLLEGWPELVQGLAPFLMPEQAQECGLNTEQEVYARARKFLRQLEIQFGDNSEHMEKILNIFHTVAETAIYREEELMKSILVLLKDFPYLQDEFLTFFDDQPPPKALFDEDFEEVDFSDELLKDPTLSQCEHVNLVPENLEASDPHVSQESHKRPKRSMSLGSNDGSKSPAKCLKQGDEDNRENVCPELVNLEEEEEDFGNTDYESEDAMDVPGQTERQEKAFTSVPPHVTVINEDAISSSPFKRITGESHGPKIPLRPVTPTGLKSDNTHSACMSVSPTQAGEVSTERQLAIPVTPGKDLTVPSTAENSGSQPVLQSHPPPDMQKSHPQPGSNNKALSPDDTDRLQVENVCHPPEEGPRPSLNPGRNSPEPIWTRQADELILTSCQRGVTAEMFVEVGQKLNCGVERVKSRLNLLLQLFDGSEADSRESEDGDIFSDSSAT